MSLAHAREARDKARETLRDGTDPGQLKRDAKTAGAFDQANTFEAVARLWWEHWRDGKSARHADYSMKRLRADAFPVLGSRPIASITAKDLTRAWQKRCRTRARLTWRTACCKRRVR